ncbi:MAG: hypothetical protein IT542_10895 [Rubellimicrobium sp.]|nr:hypothetical protein [Rubellimicrobium sp.]
MIRAIAVALALSPAVAAAQSVGECEGWRAEARSIAEPWERNTATFANGAVRIAVMDAVEPGAAAFHLLVLTPPLDELGVPLCRMVSLDADGFGFAWLELDGMERSYDPARGLTLRLHAARWDESAGTPAPALLEVTINQATGQVSARLQ